MASFFGKKAPSSAEVERESKVKKNITQEFSRALKTLQREHINSAEPIYSDDLANSVCNVLEAVFLHGLKGSTAKKITGYLVGSSVDSESLNFWQLVKKFSHSDVVSQLNHLGQITSEVGMCRAWVRVALNEGLMESYLDAMMADKSTMAYYYKRTAYLRDLEEPGILKTYLQGLSEFQFQLSYNSSVLNAWTTAPLTLSAVWEATPTPSAVLAPVPDGAVAERLGSVDYGIPAEPEQTSPLVAPRSSQRSDKPRKRSAHTIDSPAPRPAAVSPGPPPNSPYDPSLLANRAAEELRRKLAGSSSPTHSEASTTSSHVSCPDPSYMDPDKSSLSTARGEIPDQAAHNPREANFVPGSEQRLDAVTSPSKSSPPSDTSPPVPGPNMGHRKSLPLEPALTDVVATRIETAQSSVAERPVTLLGVVPRSERANSIRSDYDPMKPDDSFDGRRSSVDVLSEADSDQNYRLRVGETGEATDSAGGVGNSLGKMSGWSSSFDGQEGPPKPINSAPVQIERDRGFSYGTLLQNYMPSSGSVTSPTMQEVLETLGDCGITQTSSSVQEEQSVEESPACSEFEIISTPVSSDMLYTSSKMYETQILIIGEICNEKGLDMQNYQCKGCARPIGLIYGSPRVCSFDGGYYCYECHENEEYYIPARIVYNWDFRKHKVAKKNREFLQEVEGHPLLDLDLLNPKVYDHVNEMNDVRVLREQLCYVKSYLFTCKQSVAEDLRKSVWPREYLYDQLHLYSLSDLLQVMSGQLATTLRKLVRFATRHIYECRLCSQKGFICEICSNPQVIYPFETESTERCELCKTVYHRSCKQQVKKCPKCQRRMQRRSRVGGDLITPDSDYSIHPDDQLTAH